jgi:hypothetical protein
VTFVFGIAEPLRITLFGGGACFFGALLVTDPDRGDRVRKFGWAAVVSAVSARRGRRVTSSSCWAM